MSPDAGTVDVPTAAATGRPAGTEQRSAGPDADRGVARRQPPRHVTRAHPCPRCGAAPQEPCQGRRGPRKSHHIERVELAVYRTTGRSLQLPRRSRSDVAEGPAVKRSDPDVGGVDGGARSDRLPGAPGSVPPPLA